MPFSSRSTYADCVEFGAWGPIRIESMFPLGESGYIPADFNGTNFDPNFFSMTPIFDPFEPRPFPLFN
jgi:penicillin G amidase